MSIRFDYDETKSDRLKKERGFSLQDASTILSGDIEYWNESKCDDPEQFIAIGFVKNQMCTLAYEYRQDDAGEYIHLITYWPSTKAERKRYEKNIHK